MDSVLVTNAQLFRGLMYQGIVLTAHPMKDNKIQELSVDLIFVQRLNSLKKMVLVKNVQKVKEDPLMANHVLK